MTRRSTFAQLCWESDGRDWPNRDCSQFVAAGGLRWHVQQFGQGPVALLLHGTGAATHSWRDLAPMLAGSFRVIALDLPGHGFTNAPEDEAGFSLQGMAEACGALLGVLNVEPTVVIGHSAGAAILARMCREGLLRPDALVSLNGALLPLEGARGMVFAPVSRLIGGSVLLPRTFAWLASRTPYVRKILAETGSNIDRRGADLYQRLASSPRHVASALRMMANWDLQTMGRDLQQLRTPLTLITGENDRTIPPADSQRVRALSPTARLILLPELGHLAHEENPALVAELVRQTLESRVVEFP